MMRIYYNVFIGSLRRGVFNADLILLFIEIFYSLRGEDLRFETKKLPPVLAYRRSTLL